MTFLITLLVVSHEELLVPGASSQEVKSSKACYTLIEVSSFESDCFGLLGRLDHLSPFLEEVDLYKFLTTLVGPIVELEGFL